MQPQPIPKTPLPKTAALLASALLLAACATPRPEDLPRPTGADVAELAAAIRALGPEVDEAEALRAAQIAYEYPLQLAVEYEIEDPPYIHNIKVNNGTKPRGLCYQWADDLEARLRMEGFDTLDLHRAIANSENAWRIEHSTVIVSAPGDDMYDGIVLDPWRWGGELYWGATVDDHEYPWLPRQEVFRRKRERSVQ
ncbi:hypothetical protein GCM10011415_32440 [Salipiger pallidus]|uniref:Lipoprotein n=1 Tax=Salipiger pallidus TaxID=1775170 RepID=A0A8J3EHI0_9RHOB|nr:hypothetical protein [Salipiger pallidus]GGG80578.1 hypothetical protein GCM10011415_32440 [Salipiger pallidus]